MQRDSTAHQVPDTGGPANDVRDTPFNRLLRKPAATPEAAVVKPLTAQAAAPATPVVNPPPSVNAPPVQPVTPEAPAGKPLTTEIVPKPLGAQVSPADMLVSKLLGRPVPGYAPPAKPATKPLRPQAPVPELTEGRAIDVEYTPVEAPASKPMDEADTVGEAAARAPVPAHDTAAIPDVAEPPRTKETASIAPIAESLAARTTPVSTPLPVHSPAPTPSVESLPPAQKPAEPPVAKPMPSQTLAQEPPAAKPVPVPGPAPKASSETPVPTPRSETPLAKAMPEQGRAQERPATRPLPPPDSVQHEPFDKPPLGPISTPDEADAEPLGKQGSALQRSIGRPLPSKESTPEKMLALPRRTRDEREFLPAALEIVDTPPSPIGRAIGLTIILLAVAAIAWACIGKVDIIATASGRIVPQGKTKIVQPADTGIVTAIHVADGDHVKAGDLLIELNSNQTVADRDRFVRDLLQARLNLARLRGLAAAMPGTKGEGRKPNLVDPPSEAKPEDLALTLAAMRAQAANENAKLADLDQQIEAKQAEAAEAEAAATKLQASLPMLADQEKLLRDMRDQKIGSKLDWYQVNQQLIEQKHEIGVLSHRKDAAVAAQRALREQRAAEASQYEMSILAELDKVRAQASELEAELAKSEQRLSQVVLRAPIDGTVQQLAVHTIGGVVTPAESLLAIVPVDDSLVVEAAVQNRDVGFIRAGQTVRVKVEAFNFTLYGLLEGEVLDVTRDAVSRPGNDQKSKAGNQNSGDAGAGDESGPVYLARIALSQDWMMTENGKVELTPGMAVTAEIQTGERRLISYLLSPLVRHVSESMHER